MACCGLACGLVHIDLSIFFRVISLALGPSCDVPSASKVILKDMDKYQTEIYGELFIYQPQANTTQQNHVNILRVYYRAKL